VSPNLTSNAIQSIDSFLIVHEVDSTHILVYAYPLTSVISSLPSRSSPYSFQCIDDGARKEAIAGGRIVNADRHVTRQMIVTVNSD
jgi:hypothetical protein